MIAEVLVGPAAGKALSIEKQTYDDEGPLG